MSDKPTLLVVEDEAHLARGLKLNFELDGYAVDTASSGREAFSFLARTEPYAAIVLDVTLPDMDGFEICRRLRDVGDYTPVIMLTARSLVEDRVQGLEAGADDYLTKPFDIEELVARVRSAIRRRGWEREQTAPVGSVLTFGEARVDFDTHEVTVRGEQVRMTKLELDLVRYFAQNSGRVVSREELLKHVWKLANHPNTRTVDNFVLRLRRHFEPDAAEPVHFLSVRGAGYRFLPDGDDDA
ncbi:MAG: response regulator transcription factor [Alphaproteobacteria bacterium]|nr:response regulator transcription factor [Alphaproteobacteria bacterium]